VEHVHEEGKNYREIRIESNPGIFEGNLLDSYNPGFLIEILSSQQKPFTILNVRNPKIPYNIQISRID
jgi:hypothetical protein